MDIELRRQRTAGNAEGNTRALHRHKGRLPEGNRQIQKLMSNHKGSQLST